MPDAAYDHASTEVLELLKFRPKRIWNQYASTEKFHMKQSPEGHKQLEM